MTSKPTRPSRRARMASVIVAAAVAITVFVAATAGDTTAGPVLTRGQQANADRLTAEAEHYQTMDTSLTRGQAADAARLTAYAEYWLAKNAGTAD